MVRVGGNKNARKTVKPFNAADLRDNYPIAPDSEEIAEIVIERIGYVEKGGEEKQ